MGNYNGLGIKFEKRLSRDVSIISAYTWSHAIDDITNSGLSVGNNGRASYPALQLEDQRSNSDTDVRHRWVNAFQFTLPFGRGKRFGSNINHIADLFVGGWQLGGIFVVESGQWFTVNQSADSANNGGRQFCGNCRQRPDTVAGQNANAGPHKVDPNDPSVHWFNVNAFQQAADGTVGNVGRNTVLGPGYANIDASLGKVFPIRERLSLQLRLEAFNAVNATNFLVASGSTSPSGFTLGNSNFGDVTADRGGRVLQIAARLVF
jgi:hypothetical protein